MTDERPRQVFSEAALSCLCPGETIGARDLDTGIKLHYRLSFLAGGRLTLSQGLLGPETKSAPCEPHEINAVASRMLDELKARPG